jgi:hypothetical protein
MGGKPVPPRAEHSFSKIAVVRGFIEISSVPPTDEKICAAAAISFTNNTGRQTEDDCLTASPV